MKKMISGQKNPVFRLAGLVRLSILAVLVGIIAGGAGSLFHHALSCAAYLRGTYPILLLFLPLSGIVIAFIYRRPPDGAAGTNLVIMAARDGAKLPGKMAPMIFTGTVLTQLCGGSAGREGAALQLGGSIGGVTGRFLRLDRSTESILVMCGMSACFSALFGTPIAAAVFVLELECVGLMRYTALLPCVISSVSASLVAKLCGVEGESFTVAGIPVDIPVLLRVILIAVICSALSVVLCIALHKGEHAAAKLLKNPYLRAAVGGAAVIGIAYGTGALHCLGAGMNIVEDAVGGSVPTFTFLLKLLLTVITVSAGFRGGEIVPAFAIGASFGCVLGPLVGLDASFAAAIAMIALFCGVTNCPLASIILAAELFSFSSPLLFAVTAAVSYAVSGYFSLYSTQSFLFSKTSPSDDPNISDISDGGIMSN